MIKWWKPAAVILITLLLAVSVKNDFLYFLLGFEVMLVIVSYLQVRYSAAHVSMQLELPQTEISKGEEFQIRVHVTNTGILPIQQLRIRIALAVFPEKEELLLQGKLMLGQKEAGDLCFSIDSSHCEAIKVRPDRMTLTDYMDIFTKKCKVDREAQETLFILPDLSKEDKVFPVDKIMTVTEEGDSTDRGDSFIDESEIRNYIEGDPIKRIHWKVSARIDELMVREMADETEESVLLYVNLKDKEGEESVRYNPDKWDSFLQMLAEFSHFLVLKDKSHSVMWIDAGNDCVAHYVVSDEESMRKMLSAMLLTDTFTEDNYNRLLKETDLGKAREKCLEIDLQGNTRG